MTLTESARQLSQDGRFDHLVNVIASSRAAAAATTVGLVATCTLVVDLVTPTVPYEASGVIYLVGVLGVSSLFGLWWGLLTSLASALAFNFFFLPPAHTFVIDASGDWAALCVFVLTAVVTSNLASRAQRERDEAAKRAEEARLSELFATLIADAADVASVLPSLARHAGRALGTEHAAIRRGGSASPPRSASVLTLDFNGRWMGELWLFDAPVDVLDSPAAHRVARSLAGLIALGDERQQRLEQQVHAEALLQSDELKTALLRAVSHDLRSPLMAITTAAGGLRYADLDAEDQELLDTIADESARMSRMVENLLELSKLQAGASGRSVWVDPRELVEASVDALPPGGQAARRLKLVFADDLPLVHGDASQLQRVVVNLVENALKFSPKGSPVQVSVERSADSVTVEVVDHGSGISTDDVDRIFEPFYRAPAGLAFPGSGLGLAIARGLAEANGCRVSVRSDVGSGSRFVLRMPLPDPG